ncbi:hypothetical protein [Oleiagrimonas soli]|uniref:Uncharacterized protein n=1 Tax=Oleiagrimonas soli TaxID=1543381 RepID=A0A841KI04_9GAMM|nr:hypothetical protein [Oleiagrimonas soli]MBB6184600.1 hypothetical protein [Oleiagrimonas soli]
MKPQHASFALIPALLLSACGSSTDGSRITMSGAVAAAAKRSEKPPISVVSVDLGRAVDDEHRITQPATIFTPEDAVYASVNTAGRASAVKLAAHWSFREGNAISDQVATVHADGPASTAFRLARPQGLPRGSYQVQISVDGEPVASREFSVN